MTTMAATPSSALNVASHGRRFVLNASLGLVGKLAHLAASVFLVAYVLRHLGLERFGLVVTSATMVAFLGLIQSGAAAGLGRQFNLLLSRGDFASLSRHYSAGVVLSCLVAGLIGVGLALLLTLLWGWTGIPSTLGGEGRTVLGLLGGASILTCLALPAVACLQAAHRIDIIEKAQLAGVLVRVAGTLTLFEVWGPGADRYALVLLIEQALVSGVAVMARCRQLPEVKFRRGDVDRSLLREVAGFNALNLVANINYVAFMQVPALLLARCEGLAVAGLYGVGLQLNNLIRGLLQPVVGALAPVATSLHATDRSDASAKLFLLTTKCFTAAAALLWTFFCFLGDAMLALWLRRDVGPLNDALPWLVAASATGVAAMPASIFTLALGRVRLPAFSGLCLATAMTVLLIGTTAAEWQPALVRSGICLLACFGAYQIVRIADAVVALKLPGTAVLQSLGLALAPALVVAPILRMTSTWTDTGSTTALALVLLLTVVIAAVVLRFACLTPSERALLARLKTSLRTRTAKEERP